LNLSFNVGDKKENVEENRNRFFGALGIDSHRVALPRQKHTSTVRLATQPGVYEECDALVTNTPGIYLSVSIADCAPVLLFDPKRQAVGCVHAGWRGTERQIVSAAVARMISEFSSVPENILAFVGPCAGPCCYEVGEDVAGLFDKDFRSSRNGRMYLDIKKAVAAQLRSAGITDSHFEVLGDCTICGSEFYHSFRRDRDKSGRMAAVIGMNQ
jgi:YfiH family protein